jgi:hypothetical protein
MRDCISFLIVGVVVVVQSSATTIVLIRTPEHIVVGADSLIVNWQSSSGATNSHACKLHKQGSTFFAIQGMGIVHPASGFSAEQLARQAVQHSASMKEASAYFARIAVEPYAAVMQSMRKESPRDWDLIERYRGKGIPLVAAFFGVERGVSKYILVGFRVSTGKRILVVADAASCPGVACEGDRQGRHSIILGQSEAAYRQIGVRDKGSLVSFQGNRSDVGLARLLVAIEERAAPRLVGGPIDVVTVDAAGERWNTPVGACLESN